MHRQIWLSKCKECKVGAGRKIKGGWMCIFSRNTCCAISPHLWSSAGMCCKVESPLALCAGTKKIFSKQGTFPNLISQNIFKTHQSSLHSFLNLISIINFFKEEKDTPLKKCEYKDSFRIFRSASICLWIEITVKECGLHNAKSLLSHQVLQEESQTLEKPRKSQHPFLFFNFAEIHVFQCWNIVYYILSLYLY